MKILQINNNHFRKSGTDSVYLNTINLLRNNGHEVFAFSSNDPENVPDNSAKYFVNKNLFNKSFGKFYSFSAKNKIGQLIKENTPDIAHFHNIIGGLSSSILPVLKKHKVPVVATFHGFKYLCPAYVFVNGKGEICEDCKVGRYYNCIKNNCAPEGRIKSAALSMESYLRDCFFPFTKYIDKYIFLSNFFLNKYGEYYPQIRDKSICQYNFFNQIEPSITTVKGKYFLYFGRLDREKGIKTLIDAFSKSQKTKLKIIGDGELRNFVVDNNHFNIEYLGYQSWDKLKNIISEASFVIVPSECYENNPMTIIESYSLGKPVIGSNIGGIPEIIIPNKTGFVFEPKNGNQLFELIQHAERLDSQTYNQLSQNSFKFAQDNFSENNYYTKLMDAYSSLVN